ncbi:hypothetical protein ACFQU7_34360 [Pseudoroseomonas wenyumeiae]
MKIQSTDRATTLAIDRTAAPGFDQFLLEQMEELYSRFLAETQQRGRKRRSGA